MPARRSGRYLAPLAIVGVLLAVALVVRSGLATTHHPTTTATTRVGTTHRARPKKRFYVIHPGDTLSSISVKTGVPVTELQALNPAIASNPNALQTGQRLRLR
jgi:LysM repeat protein